MSAIDPDSLLLVGRIFRPHGVQGKVKVIPETDVPERFELLDTLYIGPAPEQVRVYSLESVRFQPTKHGVTVVLGLEAVATREAADALRQLQVYAHRDDLPPLEEEEYYLSDLVGMAVITEAGEPVGVIQDVLEMAAHDQLLVSREGKPDALIPAVPAFIDDIDFETGTLRVSLIEGLLD